MDQPQATLSLCMIVKDEEDVIARCLESIHAVVDEMIIVDTGSADRTRAICEEYEATVLDYPWGDDFSSARNAGIRKASCDWILWLDADEVLEQADAPLLRRTLNTANENYLAIHLINFYGETASVDASFQIAHTRLFRNHMGIEFEGRIHEHLNLTNIRDITDIPVRVYHYGYMQDVAAKKNKRERNIGMLQKELKNPDSSPWVHYHLASEYFNGRRYTEAFEYVNAAILAFLLQGLKPPALVYRLKYLTLLNHGSADGALAGIDKAIEMYPDYVDLHFFKGVALITKQRHKEALQSFRRCLALGEKEWKYLTMRGVGSFIAWYYVGKCFESMGKVADARAAYQEALSMAPTYSPAADAIEHL